MQDAPDQVIKPTSRSWLVWFLAATTIALLVLSVILVFQNQQLKKQLAPSARPVNLPAKVSSFPVEPTPTPDPTAGWETYENKEWGVSFKYPDDHQIGETQGHINISSDPLWEYGLRIEEETRTIDEFKESLKSGHQTDLTESSITLGGQVGAKLLLINPIGFGNADNDHIYIVHPFNDKKMNVVYDEEEQIHQQILASFRFLD